jgi:5-methylcytosine-specific restriction endonuclease McrA
MVGKVHLQRHHRLRQRRLQPDRRRALQQLCRQRLDAFREQRGEEVDHIVPRTMGGSDDLSNLQASDTLRRSDQNGKVAATSERRISRVSGSMGEGSKPMWR